MTPRPRSCPLVVLPRRLLASAAGALVLTAGVVASPGAPAIAAPTCLDEVVTLVGPGPGGVLTGTAGDDVILTEGATEVDALGGDDVVCVTGTDADLSIDAGEGDDVVNAYTYDDPPAEARGTSGRAPAPVVTVDLGPGRDRGRLATDDGPDNTYDDTDAGAAETFVLDGGGGDLDRLELESWWQVDKDEPLDGDVYLDLAGRAGSLGDEVAVTFDGFESYTADAQGTATILGTDGPDHVAAYGCGSTVVKTGPGSDLIDARRPLSDDDEYWCVPTRGAVRGHYFYAGAHGDRIGLAVAGVVRGGTGSDRIDARYTCFGYAYHDDCGAVLRGEDGDDELLGGAAFPNDVDVLDGGSGDDYLNGGAGPDRLYGYAGDDQLFGSRGSDRIYGGAGRDTARGGTEVDLCRAESRKGCER